MNRRRMNREMNVTVSGRANVQLELQMHEHRCGVQGSDKILIIAPAPTISAQNYRRIDF